MFSKVFNQLYILSNSRRYWLSLAALSLTLLAVALIFQYVIDELPCLLCIQVRLWLSLLALVSALGYFTRNIRWMNVLSNLSVVAIAIGLTERSYQLLGTERGFVFGDCGFTLGLPAWFAIDDWLPWLYRIETSCGYTPEIIFGITMAEALLVISIILLLASVFITLAAVLKR